MPYNRSGSDNDMPGNGPNAASEDAPTRRINRAPATPMVDEDAPTRARTSEPDTRRSLFDSVDEDMTTQIRRPDAEGSSVVPSGGDETRVFRRSRRAHSEATNGAEVSTEAEATSQFMDDPVVGWLAIVEGPGQGTAVALGSGLNTLGRSDDSRVPLNYGDTQLSRENHATVTYDPRGRKFYLQHGGGKNLTYLNDAPVLTPVEIVANQDIVLGNTRLRFVPLCGPDFDWQDVDAG